MPPAAEGDEIDVDPVAEAGAGAPDWATGPLHVGISGWTYAPWRGVFYPPRLPHRSELAHASRRLNSIEINGSFYALQLPASYQRWYAETPPGFRFSVKGPRFITHMKKLAGVEEPLANFLASGILALGDKLGPILWQLPPTLGYNGDRLADFFRLLPRTTAAAAELAAKHEDRMTGRAHITTDLDRPLRHALEVRHASFETPAFVELLREHDIALVCADTAGKWPMLDDVTSSFVYLRLHGADELYVSGYDDAAIERWAKRVRLFENGLTPADGRTLLGPAPVQPREVFVYFDNDVKVKAPFNAMALRTALGIARS